MANREHLEIINKGVSVWNQWRQENPSVIPNLSTADLDGSDLRGADLHGAKLGRAKLSHSNLSGADLRHAILPQAVLYKVNLREANLQMAQMQQAVLREAVLSRADLFGADLTGTNLSKSLLNQTQLDRIVLRDGNLKDAILCGASLVHADLGSAHLNHADLSFCILIGANFRNSDLDRTNFRNSSIGSTVFQDVDFSNVQGLEEVRHESPSEVSLSTIYRSKGNIPESFLRRAGVPGNFIEYMHSLVGTAFEFYSCFISYSSKDQEFANRLHADLQDNGVRCWFAPHDLKAGEKLHEQIDEAIRVYEKLLLVLSPNSVNSEWVKTEIAKARKREVKEGKRVLFPIRVNISYDQLRDWECFDADTGKDSAREIREFFIPDFTNWND